MIQNFVPSILHVVASGNILKPDELTVQGEKTIAELFNEKKEDSEQINKKLS